MAAAPSAMANSASSARQMPQTLTRGLIISYLARGPHPQRPPALARSLAPADRDDFPLQSALQLPQGRPRIRLRDQSLPHQERVITGASQARDVLSRGDAALRDRGCV